MGFAREYSEPRLSQRMVSRPVVRIVGLSPDATMVYVVDAVVVEDDTYLILGADPVPRETHDPPQELLKRARASIQPAPGTLVVREGKPQRFHAIVHELDHEPSWRAEWVARALREALQEAERRELRRIAVPLLGGVHGSVAPDRFANLLTEALAGSTFEHLDEVWLTLPSEAAAAVAARLRGAGIEVREEGRT